MAKCGFNRIELSGGTDYYQGIFADLVNLKKELNLHFRLHNYFPPPQEHFVLNLASLNGEIFQRTINHYLTAIEMSHELGCSKLGIHAGYLIDIEKEYLGKTISNAGIIDKVKSMEQFCVGWNILKERANGLELYIENNVISQNNYNSNRNSNPFMLTNYEEYKELRALIDFRLLLDVGHLFVSSNTLGLDFKEELNNMITESDYLHISDNNGFSDQNKGLNPQGIIYSNLKKMNLTGKTITLEIYGDMNEVSNSTQLLREDLLI
ncbi:MAG: TIM barrel protein [Candidatus Stygibacter australis]|nr:TIM barrel protein [Candidatus Stygibacter australis]MDP8321128.1 TIM barrel protein [Candidatus Stygibacter australis]